jgi:alkylated DNA repair dioxygenase AlkB
MEMYLHSRVRVYRAHIPPPQAARYFTTLRDTVVWQHPHYDNLDGRRVFLPRLTANYGEESYDYSGLDFTPLPWTPLLAVLRGVAEALSGVPMNALILQRYRDGRDRVQWHADDNPRQRTPFTIVSMSFGASRTMQFRDQVNKDDKIEIPLHSGDVLVMGGDLQQTHHYRIRQTRDPCGDRINLTFRCL